MHFLKPLTLLLSGALITSAISLPNNLDADNVNLLEERSPRGGGGGRGGGSIGGSIGGSSGGSRGTSGSSGSSGSSGRTSGSSRGTSSSSNAGGTSARGTGVQPSYGGRYAGGATRPYAAGARSPGGLLPLGILGVGTLATFWIISGAYGWGAYGAYNYRYPTDITYYNQTSMMNVTLPGQCLCSRYRGCSCDALGNSNTSAYVNSLIGDGSYAYQQEHLGTFQLSTVNGTRQLFVNGTLANGTTAAAGNAASGGSAGMAQKAALVGLCAMVGSAVFAL